MKNLLVSWYSRPLTVYLIGALIALTAFAGPAEAMLVPAPHQAAASADRTADLAKIRTALEMKTVQQRLLDYGLTPEETLVRINSLSDEQVHQIAMNADSVQAGGDVIGFLFAVVLIAALVVLIIFLLEGRIEIRKR